MAGYIGSKTVNLSTTGADIAGDADVSGALDVGGAFTSQGIDDNATSTAMTLDASGSIGIGTSSPDRPLHVTRGDGTGTVVKVGNTGSSAATIEFANTGSTDTVSIGAESNDLVLKSDDGDISLNTTGDPATASLYIERGGNVGIGTSSPYASNGKNLEIYDASTIARLSLHTGSGKHWGIGSVASDSRLSFYDIDSSSEAMRIDSSGRLYVGTTNTAPAINNVAGFVTINGAVQSSVSGGISGYFNRMSTDGDILQFRKNGSTVGRIGNNGSDFFITRNGGGGIGIYNAGVAAATSSGSYADNTLDLGSNSVRWDDIYATNGTIQTSDEREKQDIRHITEAETRVAQACKGLLKAYRWKDAVAEKGHEARTHFGIIAQDLQAAFAAEGLDAGDYAMFISSTWWEHDVEVPAVEAVAEVTETTTDEDGNEVVTVVTEAVEAVDAYTRTDTYDTQEEAPEGATERTRLGVRYSELLAFIIGAL